MSLPDVHPIQPGATVNFPDFLKNFALDYWYKMLIAASIFFMVIALTVKIYAVPNAALFLLATGGFLIGMGEWVNHPYQERINLDHGFKVTGHPRRPRIGGVTLDFVGAILLAIGAVKAILVLV
ncbi:hypothetical protein [Burkholderia gladioli]|uniref:hypothetical protein n=1 Tax=Burkholderia gladioli TaxID=28095 RepID=UPI0016411A8D|nr:hypothetical protein [Burkholderia gladioli]